jgi:hypothetical protein
MPERKRVELWAIAVLAPYLDVLESLDRQPYSYG